MMNQRRRLRRCGHIAYKGPSCDGLSQWVGYFVTGAVWQLSVPLIIGEESFYPRWLICLQFCVYMAFNCAVMTVYHENSIKKNGRQQEIANLLDSQAHIKRGVSIVSITLPVSIYSISLCFHKYVP
eukprot:GHVL01022412.1.p1 GENE.GHVL01022412.1~~GHVL01022412.1.p1  ORF type:complete len:126 (+),score=11.79 GHVL01022412.1:247-624(+)